MDFLHWSRRAGDHGISRAVLELAESPDTPEAREFLLIYVAGAEWARWGIARCCSGVEVWRTEDGLTIGRHATLALALASLVAI